MIKILTERRVITERPRAKKIIRKYYKQLLCQQIRQVRWNEDIPERQIYSAFEHLNWTNIKEIILLIKIL